jgi:pre-mRNA-processing factor SLU7
MHLQANPTAGAFHRRKEQEVAEKLRAEKMKALQEKYGGEEDENEKAGAGATAEALRAVAVTESETFVEYDESGAIKGAPKAAAKSKYPEDVYHGNHTSVWGSWWHDFRWGYACCRSFVKNSYCTGEAGVQAWEAAERQRTGAGLLTENGEPDGEGEEQKLKETMPEPDRKERKSRKRTAVQMGDGVTEQELDEYRKKRTAVEDPMAKLLGKDELLQ